MARDKPPCYYFTPEYPRVISLAAYAIKVWNPSDKEHEVISNFDGDGADFSISCRMSVT